MFGLVAAVELLVAWHPLDFSDPVSLNWRLSAEAARKQAPGASILYVGDSLVKHSVIPSVIEARTGRRGCNLGLARGPAPATYFLLRRALESGARPAAVVVDFKPGVLVGSPRYNIRYWQEILTPRECLELVRTDGGGSSLLITIGLGRLLPSFRSRHEIRGAVLAAFRGESNPLRLINEVCRRNWRVNGGANVAARNPAFTGEVGPDQKPKLLWHMSYCHRANLAYIRRLMDLTAGKGVPVYWLLPPLSPDLQAKREASRAEEAYIRLVRSFQDKYPLLRVVDGRHAGYGPDVFVDATHLDGQGANTLSNELAEILRRDLGSSAPARRWVHLPDFRPYPVGAGSEDVEQSKRIVYAESAAALRR